MLSDGYRLLSSKNIRNDDVDRIVETVKIIAAVTSTDALIVTTTCKVVNHTTGSECQASSSLICSGGRLPDEKLSEGYTLLSEQDITDNSGRVVFNVRSLGINILDDEAEGKKDYALLTNIVKSYNYITGQEDVTLTSDVYYDNRYPDLSYVINPFELVSEQHVKDSRERINESSFILSKPTRRDEAMILTVLRYKNYTTGVECLSSGCCTLWGSMVPGDFDTNKVDKAD